MPTYEDLIDASIAVEQFCDLFEHGSRSRAIRDYPLRISCFKIPSGPDKPRAIIHAIERVDVNFYDMRHERPKQTSPEVLFFRRLTLGLRFRIRCNLTCFDGGNGLLACSRRKTRPF